MCAEKTLYIRKKAYLCTMKLSYISYIYSIVIL